MKSFFYAFTALGVVACSAPDTVPEPSPTKVTQEQTETEAAKLNAWFDEQYQADLSFSPMAKTRRGLVDEDYGKWDDISAEHRAEEYQRSQAQLAAMKEQFDFDKLDREAQLSWRLFEYHKDRESAGWPYRDHLYTFNQMFGLHVTAPTFLISQHEVTTQKHAEAYVSRLYGMGTYLEQGLAQAERAYDAGIVPPGFVFEHVLRDITTMTSGAPFEEADQDSPLWADFKSKLSELDLPADQNDALLEDARKALQESVQPAYQKIFDVLNNQRTNATEDAGAWALPDGADFYAYRLKDNTTTDLTPGQIHELGLQETTRIHDEMRDIMQQTGFEGSLQEFFEFMRTDDQFRYSNDADGRDQYRADATAIIDGIRDRLDEMFITQPKAPLVVRAVEPYREQSAARAFYSAPAEDGSRPGIYYINLYDMTTITNYSMRALAYHEGLPGHHMQIAIAQELESIPLFRKYSGVTAYSEGWGLYSEWLPLEMGLYDDPYSNFGRLSLELLRAGRLVVDTGLHHKRWTVDEATDWLVDNTPTTYYGARRAVERYVVMPGQATAYKIGMVKIQDLRDQAEVELGDDFDVREFHDVILRSGAVPLSLLEEIVNDWVQTKKGS
ncbi:DUF885 domain-containing protein [uncultured Hyphomonas sp.]|uniref:DUF885 domain-containing protein n=1 Tax=uncultured Hyphomonas sp. TaxID=225298 RepID=UPI002AAAC7D0|nr:DUF885 domain-containing protein [uncultured Hyphomonas sp.]